jgi:hypothetical protein
MFKILLLYFQIFQRTPDEPDVGENCVALNNNHSFTLFTQLFTNDITLIILYKPPVTEGL